MRNFEDESLKQNPLLLGHWNSIFFGTKSISVSIPNKKGIKPNG